ncbi:DUF3228 family protein [bacterium]|nr:DUF3228 family protein [bacterium]MBU1072893.1 DUF3228 family protein [bacterium]MBU1675909.1 DUF3228 family protein [bacterium]
MSAAPTIGWSAFAAARYRPGTSHSHFLGTDDALIGLVRDHWRDRRPGEGRDGLAEVVVVPVPPERFVCATVEVDETTPLHAVFTRRQTHEDGYVEVSAEGEREPARHAAVVLYSAATLLENGGARSTGCDWEIVCLIAAPVADAPMDPLTMARNMLAKPGGTPCRYTAGQFAAAVWYWRDRARIHVDGGD